MEALTVNSSSNNCGQTLSSNCVPYNGILPIPCLNVCTGASTSDVLYKLGNQICYVQSLIDLSTLNLTCLYTPCPNCQNPTSPTQIFQILIDTICTQATQIATLQTQMSELIAGTSVQ